MTRLLYLRLLPIIILSLLPGCDVDGDENIYCEAEIVVELPDNAAIALLRPDNSLDGSFCRNLNTQMEYTLPVFVNNRCTMRVQKGIYLLSFDGQAIMVDGSVRSVRLAGYSVTREAVYLLGDYESVTLQLSYLD